MGRDGRHAKGPDRAPLHVGGENFSWGLRGEDFSRVGVDAGLVDRRWRHSSPSLRLSEPIALAVHLENVDMVREAIEQCAGQTLIAEYARPLVERQIGGDDRRGALVPLAEHLKQQLRPGLRERHIAELVDDEQLDRGKLRLEPQEALLVARLHQLMDEPRRRCESDGKAALASGEPERQRHMALAGPAVAERDDILATRDERAAAKLQRQHLVEAGNGGEVESVEALDRREPGLADSPFGDPAFAIEEFEFDEPEQIPNVVDAVARGLACDFLIFPQNGRQLELLEVMGGRSRRRAGPP